jgi:hypothetical protein
MTEITDSMVNAALNAMYLDPTVAPNRVHAERVLSAALAVIPASPEADTAVRTVVARVRKTLKPLEGEHLGFEEWARTEKFNVEKTGSAFMQPRTEWAYRAWKAGIRYAQRAVEPLLDSLAPADQTPKPAVEPAPASREPLTDRERADAFLALLLGMEDALNAIAEGAAIFTSEDSCIYVKDSPLSIRVQNVYGAVDQLGRSNGSVAKQAPAKGIGTIPDDDRIRQLMKGLGFEHSISHYQAFKQAVAETRYALGDTPWPMDAVAGTAAPATPQTPEKAERRERLDFLGAARQALQTSGLTREQVIIADDVITEAVRDAQPVRLDLLAFQKAVYQVAGKRPDTSRHHEEPEWNVDLFEVERIVARTAP